MRRWRGIRQARAPERWLASMTNTLLNKGVITSDELGRRMAEVEARQGEGAG